MTSKIGIATANAALNAIVDSIDSGGAGRLDFYAGDQPNLPGDAPSGQLLGSINLSNPAFGDAGQDGSNPWSAATLAGSPTGTATAAGTAGFCRIVSGAGATILDCGVTATGNRGDCELSSISFQISDTIQITSFVLRLGYA